VSLFDYHWRATLRPLSRFITRAISGWVLASGTELELDPTSYIQPGPIERANYYQTMVGMGAMTIEEVRLMERLSKIDQPTTAPDSGEVFSNAGI
jgi:hypothetical protein